MIYNFALIKVLVLLFSVLVGFYFSLAAQLLNYVFSGLFITVDYDSLPFQYYFFVCICSFKYLLLFLTFFIGTE